MATSALRSLWAEPRPTNAPDRGPRDWALVASTDLLVRGGSGVSAGPGAAPAAATRDARGHGPPTVATHAPAGRGCGLLGTLTIVDIVRILTGSQGTLLNSTSATLILTYALFRWGSGREAASGLGVILLWLPITIHGADPTSLAEAVAGIRVLPVRRRARRRDPLSREDPHPRHRPSQGPRTRTARSRAPRHRRPPRLGHRHPGPSRTCRRGRPPRACHRGPGHHRGRSDPHPHRAARHRRCAPRHTGHRVRAAARRGRGRAARHRWPDASLRRGDAVRRVRRPQPGVGTAIYRLAQESITNARRHARHATQVTVAVTGDADQVRLTIDDDGSAAGGRAPAGYGLVGMRERACMLGGTFHAGPAAERGWRVEAVLPRTGTPR